MRPGPFGLASAPSTLSVGDTRWNCSGWRASSLPARPLAPVIVRPTQRISVLLPIGPTACDASAELPMCANVGARLLPRKPQIVAPLNSSLASPDQNNWRRHTAPSLIGAWRNPTRRSVPNTVLVIGVQSSAATCGSGLKLTNWPRATPWTPTMSSLVISVGVYVWPGPVTPPLLKMPSRPGSMVLNRRASEPNDA